MKVRKTFLYTLFVLFLLPCFSQEQGSVTLREVLDSLSTQHGISFSYLDEAILNVTVERPGEPLELEEVLSILRNETGLLMEEIGPGSYAIRRIPVDRVKVCGYILDGETKDPLPGATIQGSSYVVTDSRGFFELFVNPGEQLEIRSLGYEPRIFNADDNPGTECPNMPLSPQITMLPEIVVDNYLSEGIHKTWDGSLLLGVEPLRMLPGLIESDVLHSLQFLPGIKSVNETVSNINIRGGTNDQNLVSFEGMRIFQTGHFFGLISVFNPKIIQDVQLIKNGTSAEYGDAVSGTIILHTPDKIPEEFHLSAGVNMLNADAYLEVPISDRSGLLFGARRSIGDMLQTPTYDSYFDRAFRGTQVINSSANAASLANSDEQFYFYDLNMKYMHHFSDRDKLNVYGLMIFNKLTFLENAVVNNITESRSSKLDQNSLAGGFTYSRWWNRKFTSEIQASVSNYDLTSLNVNLFENQELLQENEALDIQFKASTRFLSGNTDYLAGYQYNDLGVTNLTEVSNPLFRRKVREVVTTHAGFVEANSSLNKTDFRAGIRTSYFEGLDEWSVEPRIHAIHPLTNTISVEISGEMKSQVIVQRIDLQTDFLGVEKRKWVLVDGIDLELLKSKQLSVGAQYSKNKVLFHIEGYMKDVEGISTISQGFLNQFQRDTETGNYLVKGIDGLVSLQYSNINSWLSYTYSDNRYSFPALVPPGFPNNLDTPHNISFGSNYRNDHLDVAVGINWHSGRPFTETLSAIPVNNEVPFDTPNFVRLPDYFRVDISAKYRFFVNETTMLVGASIWNLLDRQNVIQTYSVVNELSQIDTIEQTALPLTTNFMISVDF